MDHTTPETHEGRIIAQRKVLAVILAHIAKSDAKILDALDGHTVASSHAEDPGADDYSPEFAIEAAIADELRLILDAARRRMG